MKTLAAWLLALCLASIPLFDLPQILFVDQAKRDLFLLAIGLVSLFFAVGVVRQKSSLVLPRPVFALLGFLLWGAISLLWSAMPWWGAQIWLTLFLGFCITILVSDHLQETQSVGMRATRFGGELFFYPLFIAVGIAAFIGLWQTQSATAFPVATFGNTNHAGEFVAALLPALFIWAGCSKGIKHLLLLTLLFMLGAYAAVLQVRATWIAGLLGSVCACYFLWRYLPRSKRIFVFLPFLFLLAGFAGVRMLAPANAPDFVAKKAQSIEVRKMVLNAAITMLAEKPLFGWGLGSFPSAFITFRNPAEIALSTHDRLDVADTLVEEPHNDYVLFANELGFLGVVCLALIALWILLRWQAAIVSPAAMAAYVGLLSIGVNALFRSPITNPSSALVFWTFLGVLCAEMQNPPRLNLVWGRWLLVFFGMPVFIFCIWLGQNGLRADLRLRANLQENSSLVETSVDWKYWEAVAAREFNLQNYAAAEQAYRKVIKLFPNHVLGNLNLGRCLIFLGKPEKAKEFIERAQILDPQHPKISIALADAAIFLGDDLEAIKQFRLWIQAGGDENILRKQAEIFVALGKFERALKFFDNQLDLHPQDAGAWNALGESFEKLGHETQARAAKAQARLLWGIEHLRAGRAHDATRLFQQYRNLTPAENLNPDLYLAAGLLAENKRDAAKEILENLANAGMSRRALLQPGLEAISLDPELRGILPD